MSLKDFPEPDSYENSEVWFRDVLKWRRMFEENLSQVIDEAIDKAAEEMRKILKRKIIGGKLGERPYTRF